MQVTVNDETRELPDGATIAELIERLGLSGQACAVEVNKNLVPKRRHADTVLAENDRLEIVTLVGGG